MITAKFEKREKLVAVVKSIGTGVNTSDATASATDILSGKTAYVNGEKVTGSIESKAAATYTPGISKQLIASGQYLSGTQTIQGDSNLISENIKSGVSIFGVSGSYQGSGGIDTSDATATADDMAKGKTAYVNGQKITGTLYEYTENTTEIFGHKNTEVSEKITDGIPYLYVRGQTTGKGVMRIGSWAEVRTPLSTLGDASASDVAEGKTFTSTAGVKVVGTAVASEQATPVIEVSSDGLITATAGDKSATKQLTTQAAQTITPGTSNKTIASGKYLTGTQTIKGDANLLSKNIKSGVSIFGVAGSYEGSGSGLSVSYDETTGELTIGGESVAYDANSGNLTI